MLSRLQESSGRKRKRCRFELLYPPSVSARLDEVLVLDYNVTLNCAEPSRVTDERAVTAPSIP